MVLTVNVFLFNLHLIDFSEVTAKVALTQFPVWPLPPHHHPKLCLAASLDPNLPFKDLRRQQAKDPNISRLEIWPIVHKDRDLGHMDLFPIVLEGLNLVY